MASEIRVDKINSLSGVGTVTLSPTGVDIAGITTAATLRATTGIVTSLTAGSLTSLGAVSGTTGTFSGAVSGTTGTFTGNIDLNSDTNKLKIGAGDDFQFFHNGSNNFIETNNGDIRIKTSDSSGNLTFTAGGSTERLRIDSNGLIANNARVPSSYGSPNLLISGTDSTLTLMGDGSSNNSSFTGIKFRVAGTSSGDYTKAGIFAQRQGGYNDLDLIFSLDTAADANSVAISDEKLRITSGGSLQVPIGSNIEIGQIASSNHADGNAGSVLLGIKDGGGAMSGVKVTNVDAGTYNDQIVTFLTAQGGVSTPTERARIDSSGHLILGATSSIGNQYSNNFTVSDSSGHAGIQIEGNNSNSNYASIYMGDAGNRYRSFLETQLGSNGNFTIATTGSGPIRFNNSGGERMRVQGSGGISFNGDTAADNALDDYEEGTFDVTLSSGSVHSNYNKMRYTKVGQVVHIQGQFRIDNNTSAVVVTSLPFTVKSHSEGEGYSAFAIYSHANDIASGTLYLIAYVSPGSTQMDLRGVQDNAATANVIGSTNGYFMVGGSYIAA